MPSLLGLQPPALLQTVLDGVGVAIFVVDAEARFVFANQAARDMLGEVGDPNGISALEWRRRCRFQDYEGRDIPAADAPMLRALAGEPIEPQYILVTLPDGRRKWLHAAGHSFSVLGLTGVLVVVTEETQEVELRRSAEQLHRIEAVGVLAGGLAHDFNNMLSVVSENVALALSDEDVPEATRKRLQQMALGVQRAARLAKRLLQFSRTVRLQIQPVEINEVVSTALELVSPLLGRSIHLNTELRPGLPMVEADPGEIEQVLVNLVMNAVDAMPDGGELELRTELAYCEEASGDGGSGPKQSVLITVADTGIGIPEDAQSRIFEPSYTTKPGKGVGLGLPSAFGIVRQHKGRITVQSSLGVGTKFSIYLPAMA